MGQKNLSPRQHQWSDILNKFSFTVNYIPGESNILADTLSHIYSAEPMGTTHAESKYVGKDEGDSDGEGLPGTLWPIFTGTAAVIQPLANDPAPQWSACTAKLMEDKHRSPEPQGAQPLRSGETATEHPRWACTARQKSVRQQGPRDVKVPWSASALLEIAGDTGLDIQN